MNAKQTDVPARPFDLSTLSQQSPQKSLYHIANTLTKIVPTVKHVFYLIKHTIHFSYMMAPDAILHHDSMFQSIMGFGFEQIRLPFEQTPQLNTADAQQTHMHITPAELSDITAGRVSPEQARTIQQTWHYESILLYPLIRPDATQGCLSLLLSTPDIPTEALPIIQHFSALAAQIVETMQLQHQLDTCQSQMATLHAVSLHVSHSLDSAKVMEQAVSKVTRVLAVEAAAISVIEDETGAPVIHAQQGRHTFAHTPVRIPKGKGIAWETLQQKTHTIIDSWDNEPRLAVPAFREKHVSTTILVPLLTGGESIGVLSAMSRVPRTFSPDEIQLLNSIADHVASALKKAALHSKTQQQAHERAFLFNLAMAIAPMQTIKAITEESLQRTLAFMDWSIGTFLIEDNTSNALVPQARVGNSDTLRILITRMRETAYQQNILHPVIINQAETPHAPSFKSPFRHATIRSAGSFSAPLTLSIFRTISTQS